jgi:HEAT repeat protein
MPAKSVPLLSERLRPVPPPAPGVIDRLLADLDNNDFAVRSKAAATLEELGEVAESALRKVLREPPSAEVRRQVERLLANLEVPVPPAEHLRLLRALTVLEQTGTPEAVAVLEKLSRGAPEARLTREARAALERLAKRPAREP